jgi:phosphoribosylformimino-5-aminoimidazole carboxamide ribotide isomerase
MVVIPAIDLLGGRLVRLTQGDFSQATVYSEDPLDVADQLASAGARRLHVVDLDAARGSGSNGGIIGEILKRGDLQLQVAGGVRTLDAVDSLIDRGARWVVMGTAAVKDSPLFERCARRHPDRLMAALDLRDEKAAVGGWTDTAPVMIGALLGRWDALPIGGVILTCIDRDGTMAGPDLAALSRVRRMTSHELQYSGGVASLEDIDKVAAAGAKAVILGRALYEGRIDLEQALAI